MLRRIPLRQIPHFRDVAVCDRQARFIRTEGDSPQGILVEGRRMGKASGLLTRKIVRQVPQANRSAKSLARINAAGRKPSPFGTERHLHDRVVILPRLAGFFLRPVDGHLPNADVAALRAEDKPVAVRAERQGLYGSIPTLAEDAVGLCPFRRQTPESNRTVGCPADQPTTIGAEGKPMNWSLVSVEREYSAGGVDRAEIPQSNRALLAACGQPAPVGRKRSRTGGHFVPVQWTPPDRAQLLSEPIDCSQRPLPSIPAQRGSPHAQEETLLWLHSNVAGMSRELLHLTDLPVGVLRLLFFRFNFPGFIDRIACKHRYNQECECDAELHPPTSCGFFVDARLDELPL